MKWILFIVMTMSNQNDGRTPIALDHIEFKTQAACEQMKTKIENGAGKPQGQSGFMGAIGAINGALNGPITNARCESVDDTPTQ